MAALVGGVDCGNGIAPFPALAVGTLISLATLLLFLVMSDIIHRRLSNRLCTAVATIALPYWLAASPCPLTQISVQLIVVLAAAVPLILLFALGVFGGGDIKLLAALLLWIPLERLAAMGVVTAIVGGALAVVVMIVATVRNRTRPTVPYGVAIATGALFALSETLLALLNQTV